MDIRSLRKHFDNRGSLFDNIDPEIVANIKHFFISKSQPGIIRGNHYHTRKQEWFYIVEGRAKIVIEDIETKHREEIEIDADEGRILFIPSNKAHAMQNISNRELIILAFVNESFDPADPDTFIYKVI